MLAFFGPAICVLLIVIWWVAGSRATGREKLVGFFGLVLLFLLTVLMMHPSMRGFPIIYTVLPWGITAFVAGLVVFPIIFHFGLGEAIGLGGVLNTDNTVGTLFITIPPALQSLGTIGTVIVAAFFIMLFFAALTSAISMLEVVVAKVESG